MIDEFCETGKIKDYQFVDLQQTLKEMDRGMTETTAEYMCTSKCPCPSTLNKSLWTEEQARQFGRTLASTDTLTIERRYRAFVLSNTGTTYDKFWDCYEYLQSTGQSSNAYYEIKDSYKDVFEALEDEFNCNGICEPGIFYLFNSILNGPP